MAFQVGNIKISGTINGLSFYDSEFGWLVRTKAGPSRKQFKTSPAFALARQNSAEFTRFSRAASIIRKMIIKQTTHTDASLYHRLVKLMRLLANADQSSARGQRDPIKGMYSNQGISLLKNFELSTSISLYDVLIASGYLKETAHIKKRKKKIVVYRTLGRRAAHQKNSFLLPPPSFLGVLPQEGDLPPILLLRRWHRGSDDGGGKIKSQIFAKQKTEQEKLL